LNRFTIGTFWEGSCFFGIRLQNASCCFLAKIELHYELCDFGMGGLSTGASPDRLDALVWAVTELVTRGVRGPRIKCFECSAIAA
jgi:hypothetical protein